LEVQTIVKVLGKSALNWNDGTHQRYYESNDEGLEHRKLTWKRRLIYTHAFVKELPVNAVQSGETAQEAKDQRGQHKHHALQEDHVNQTCFAQALHSHDTKFKRFRFDADHQERVNQ